MLSYIVELVSMYVYMSLGPGGFTSQLYESVQGRLKHVTYIQLDEISSRLISAAQSARSVDIVLQSHPYRRALENT